MERWVGATTDVSWADETDHLWSGNYISVSLPSEI